MNPGLAWVHMKPMVRLELTTSGLQNRCSTTELHRPMRCVDRTLKTAIQHVLPCVAIPSVHPKTILCQ